MRTTDSAAAAPKKPKKPAIPKFWRDITEYMADGPLVPGKESPVCVKCGLHDDGCAKSPYIGATGADDPLITVIFESVGRAEDEADALAVDGSRNGLVRKHLETLAREVGIDAKQIRYTSLTLCANRTDKKIEFKTRGNWCRAHLVRDLALHRPKLIIPVGTAVLGRLSHKSNAQDWAGRVLTYRGWPDDWLTNKTYDQGSSFTGVPDDGPDIPMVPIQAPYIVYATQNPQDVTRWQRHMRRALELARDGATAMNYDRPWFHLATEVDDVIKCLGEIPDDAQVTYDLETKGLIAFIPAAGIVFVMFRWVDPDGMPRALGFPWDYDGSPLSAVDRAKITPHLHRVLYNCRLRGHNVSFDLIYTYAQLPGTDLVKLTAKLDGDTRQMLYALRQTNESRGLELVAYDWCPDMAGYEEAFELLKRREPELLDPGEGKGGHYANVPRHLWPTVLKPYVMGDVEVAHHAAVNLEARLLKAKVYQIPLADPNNLGSFRDFQPPSRHFMYRNFMLPAQRVLTRVMARGMYVDQDELHSQEDLFPKLIREAKEKLRNVDPRVVAWAQQQAATVPEWELDLESRGQLRTILFDILGMPVTRLTESGQKIFKDEDIKTIPRAEAVAYAAIDKFTLNGLVAENPKLAPLQDYRKLHKSYVSFVRSMRNITTAGIDKKERKKPPYMQADGMVHANFNQCATRSGRLGVSNPNQQQLPRDAVIKRMYASRFGKDRGCIYQADLSQIELRLLAAGCGDPLMVKAYRDKIDLHSLTSSHIYKIPYEHFEKSYMAGLQKAGHDKEAKDLNTKRSVGKLTNFLTGYGGGAYGLQTTLAETGLFLPIEECERIVEALFDTYPSLRKHISKYKGFILDHACAVSITGRVRVFEEVFSEDQGIVNKALRSGFNHLIQSTASDLMLFCMAVIEFLMRETNLESILISTVHDSIVIDAVRAELPVVHEIVDAVINNMPDVLAQVLGPDYDLSWLTIVPIEGDAEVGPNYFDCRKIVPDADTKQVDWDALFKTKAA